MLVSELNDARSAEKILDLFDRGRRCFVGGKPHLVARLRRQPECGQMLQELFSQRRRVVNAIVSFLSLAGHVAVAVKNIDRVSQTSYSNIGLGFSPLVIGSCVQIGRAHV